MVAADALAVIIGAQLGARLPETIVKRAAAVAFAVFGLILLWQAISG
jgi:putative Ca2+/H+ antiporter (TMEM165/GDT1 family)